MRFPPLFRNTWSAFFGTRGVLFLSFPATHPLVLPVPVLLLAVGAENNRHERIKRIEIFPFDNKTS
jgi:hypothetical protein